MAEPIKFESEVRPIPKGMLFTVTAGVYSDYGVMGVFRAVADIDVAALVNEYLSEMPRQRKRHQFNEREFLAWLYRRGVLEAVQCMELHLGDYSAPEEIRSDEMDGVDPAKAA